MTGWSVVEADRRRARELRLAGWCCGVVGWSLACGLWAWSTRDWPMVGLSLVSVAVAAWCVGRWWR